MRTTNKIINKKTDFSLLFFLILLITFTAFAFIGITDKNSCQEKVFFFDKNNWFMDFYNTVYYTVDRTPYTWGWLPARNYLPFSYLILYPFSFLYPYDVNNWDTAYLSRYSQYSAIGGCAFITASFLLLFYVLYKAMNNNTEHKKIGILIGLFLSGITIFNFDRANEIVLSAALLFMFLLTYKSENRCYNHLGYICLAMSAALKLFPAVFGILLIYDKKYKDAIITVIYGLIFAVIPFFWLSGSFFDNIAAFINNLKIHSETYFGSGYGFSNYGLPAFFQKCKIPYIFLVISLFVSKYLKKDWQRYLLLSLAIILTSGQQEYYCLIYLFYPIVLFLNEKQNFVNIVYVFILGLLLMPLQYDFSFLSHTVNNNSINNLILLIVYISLIIYGVYCYFSNKKLNLTAAQ